MTMITKEGQAEHDERGGGRRTRLGTDIFLLILKLCAQTKVVSIVSVVVAVAVR